MTIELQYYLKTKSSSTNCAQTARRGRPVLSSTGILLIHSIEFFTHLSMLTLRRSGPRVALRPLTEITPVCENQIANQARIYTLNTALHSAIEMDAAGETRIQQDTNLLYYRILFFHIDPRVQWIPIDRHLMRLVTLQSRPFCNRLR